MKKLIYIMLVMTMITACSEPTQINVDDTLPEYTMLRIVQKWALASLRKMILKACYIVFLIVCLIIALKKKKLIMNG